MCSMELVADDRPPTHLRLPSDSDELRSVRFLLGSKKLEINAIQPHDANGFAILEILIKAPAALCPGCGATCPVNQNHAGAAPPSPVPSPPTPRQSHQRRQTHRPLETELTPSIQESSPGENEAARRSTDEGREEEGEELRLRVKEEWVKKMRGWLMVVATLVASVAFQAGMNPPKVIDEYYAMYVVFITSNSTAFGLSLGSIILLLGENTFHGRFKLQALRVFVVGAIFALAVAFCFACYKNIMVTLIFFGALFMFLVFVSMLTWWYNTKRGEAMIWRLRSLPLIRMIRRRSNIRRTMGGHDHQLV